jgi:hypothetical protein
VNALHENSNTGNYLIKSEFMQFIIFTYAIALASGALAECPAFAEVIIAFLG